jgi:hypothetical protein
VTAETSTGSGWSDPDTRTSAALVIGAVALLVVIGTVFRDVNPG